MTWRLNNSWHTGPMSCQHRTPFPSWFTCLLAAPSVSTSCLSQAPHSSPCPRKSFAKENQLTPLLPAAQSVTGEPRLQRVLPLLQGTRVLQEDTVLQSSPVRSS